MWTFHRVGLCSEPENRCVHVTGQLSCYSVDDITRTSMYKKVTTRLLLTCGKNGGNLGLSQWYL